MDISELLKQAQKAKAGMEDMQKQLADLQVEAESGAGMVKVIMNGNNKIVKLELSDALLAEPKDVQESLIQGAVNLCLDKVKGEVEKKQRELISSAIRTSSS